MSTSQLLLFVIVGQNEPLYEAEFHKTVSTQTSDSATRQNYFVLHSALDLVEKAAWTTNNMYLKVVDKVSCDGNNTFSTSQGQKISLMMILVPFYIYRSIINKYQRF